MKTPREILFERHRQAGPRLDAIRRNVLAKPPAMGNADALQPGPGAGLLFGAVLKKAWLELIWPSRRAWVGMAAVWLAVLAANLEMKAAFRAVPVVRSALVREVVQALEEQRRLLAELLPPVKPPPTQPETRNPKPETRKKSETRNPKSSALVRDNAGYSQWPARYELV